MEEQVMSWFGQGEGCLACGALLSRTEGSDAQSRLPDGERLWTFVQRTTGDTASLSADKVKGRVCARCLGLLLRLERAERRWLSARDEFLLVLGRTPPPRPAPSPTRPSSPFESLPIAFSPPRQSDSSDDDEPLFKFKENDSLKHESNCPDCGIQLESHEMAVEHALSHHVDNSGPRLQLTEANSSKKKKHLKKHKRKSITIENDDDWKLPKKTKTKKECKVLKENEPEFGRIQKKLKNSDAVDNVPYPATETTDSNNTTQDSLQADSENSQTERLFEESETKNSAKRKKSKELLSCSECSATFTTQARLDVHMVKHDGTKPPYICEICGASYKHKKACDIHVGMHKGISPWKCTVCDKIFPSKGALSRHEAIHTGTPNYQCDLCGKSFIHTSSFKMHKLSHSGLKPHTCTKCGLSLMTRSHLKRHQRVHSGEKRHECDSCGKKFSERYNLYAHQRGHYGNGFEGKSKTHDCSVCDSTFTRRNLLEKHMEIVHQRVMDTPARRPRNTMSKHLKQQMTETKDELIEIKVSTSPTPPAQLKIESAIPENIFVAEEVIQRDIKPDIQQSEIIDCKINMPPIDPYQPWERIPSLSNDFPLRMHGVDYAGYLNRQ